MRSYRDAIQLMLKAAQFAAQKHKDQRRKDTAASPYINHPLTLANILREEGDVEDPTVIAAALLHDSIEDTQTSYDELRGQFGAEIAEIVAEVTDTKWLTKASRKRLQISKAARASHGAKLVKLADICATSFRVPRRIGPWSASVSTSIGRRQSSTRFGAPIRSWKGDSISCIARDRSLNGAGMIHKQQSG
jgi:hypothetical protein